MSNHKYQISSHKKAPFYPKIDGRLYHPSTAAACGTATAPDDSLLTNLPKIAKRAGFQ